MAATPDDARTTGRRRVRAFAPIPVVALLGSLLTLLDDVPPPTGSPWLLFGLLLVAFTPLALRRRLPLAVFWWTALVATGFLVVGWATVPVLGVLVAVFSVGRARLRALAALLGFLPAAVALVVAWGMWNTDEVQVAAASTVVWGLVVGGVWGAGRALLEADRRRLLQRQTLLEAARQRRRHERMALARELHDNVAGSVSAMVVQAAGAKALRNKDPARADAALDLIAHTGTTAVEQMQTLLRLLRADDDAADLLVAGSETYDDLPELLQEAERRGLKVELNESGEPHGVTQPVSVAAYRVIQESLTNALKHAGAGSAVDVELRWRPAAVEVQVRSHAGEAEVPDLPSTGFGLAGLGERIRLVGGTFSFRQEPDAFVTSATLPLESSGSGH